MDFFGLLCIKARNFLKNIGEGRLAEFGGGWKIGATPERLALRGEKHGKGPAALLAESVESAHVNRVNVGSFFAVDFNIDEKTVHQRGDVGVFETLMGHDMAPVTSGVTDREKNRFIFGAGSGESIRPPRIPVNRIVLVLEEIGAGFVGEAVHEYPLAA